MLLFILILFQFTSAHANDSSEVRVRLLKSAKQVEISGFGLRLNEVHPPFSDSLLPIQKKINVKINRSDWEITDSYSQKVWLVKSGRKISITGEIIKVDGNAVPDNIVLLSSSSDSFAVIASLPMSEYLKGVLPSEMPATWPLEAFKAQAVAARSYVMSHIRKRVLADFHVDDTVIHQVFNMQNYRHASLKIKNKMSAAVDGTRGQYLRSANGLPYQSYFHSDCGGKTEDARHVWGGEGKTETVHDENCKLNPLSRWQSTLDKSELELKLRRYFKLSNKARFKGMSVSNHTISGRVNELDIQFSESDKSMFNKKMTGQEFRRIFGFDRVKSAFFSLKSTQSSWYFKGRGHGHGVGMCQKGARFMALAGANYIEIIKRYYPEAQLSQNETLYSRKYSE